MDITHARHSQHVQLKVSSKVMFGLISAKGFHQKQTVVPGFLCEILDVKPHNLEDCRFEPGRRKLEKAIRGELLCFLFSNHYYYKYL